MRKWFTVSAAVMLMILLVPAVAAAKPGSGHGPGHGAGPGPGPAACVTVSVSGSVTAFKYSPKGELDGFFLADGAGIRFKPHEAVSVDSIVDIGSNVRVDGCQRTGPAGDTHLKASTIANLDTGMSVTTGQAGTHLPGTCVNAVSVSGSVTSFKYAPKGEFDGFFLADGSAVRFPPHTGYSVDAMVDIGSNVVVDGCQHTGRAGDTHFKALTITNLDTGQSVTIG